MVDALRQDVRYAWRTMRRAPGFAAVAIGSAALGIGACSIIVAIVAFTLFQQLPVDEPGRLLSIAEQNSRTGEAGNQLSYPDLLDLRRARAFDGLAGADSLVPASIGGSGTSGAAVTSGAAGGVGDPERRWGAIVTANYFAVVRPGFVAGRGFDVNRDDRPGEPPVVVLSHRLWQTRFGGNPEIVGQTVTLNGRAVTVVGVTAAGFRGTELGIASDFWIPFSMISEVESRRGRVSQNRHRHWLEAVGRLRPGVDLQAARAELDVLASAMNAADVTDRADRSRGFSAEQAGRISPALRGTALALFTLLLVATSLILLTACANVANLLLGRASMRRREIAARLALGASRGRLLRQLLTESLLLALAGGTGGWIVAVYGVSLVEGLRIPLAYPIDLAISLDSRVLLFSIALSIATGVIFGLVPALRATRLDLVTDLKSDTPGTTAARAGAGWFGKIFGLRHALVIAQVAICTVLLLCTGLFLRSLQSTRAMDFGIGHRNLLLLAFDPSLDRHPDPQARQLLRDILERARGVPGVESATLTTGVPLTLIMDSSSFVPASQEPDPTRARIRTDIYSVAPEFFATMGIPFLAGRDFGAERAPVEGAPEGVAIVNEAFARTAFPGESAIDRRITGDGKRLRIIGVVATAKSRTIGEAPKPSIYLPILTDYVAAQSVVGVTLVVKTRDTASAAVAAYAAPLRNVIRQADPSLAVYDVRTLDRHLDDALIVPRLASLISMMAGGIGLAIAAIGVYGVISFAVARRRREIGIRLAIGARPGEIILLILRHGLALTLIGTIVGVLAGASLTRTIASYLYGVDPRDTMTFVSVPAFLLLVALAACLVPARAAAHVDPVDVLRSE